MSHFRLSWNALKIHYILKKLIVEKETSLSIYHKKKTRYGLRQRFTHCYIDSCILLRKCLFCTYFIQKFDFLHQFSYRLFKDGSLENFLFKSIIGFLSGLLMTFFVFFFVVIQLRLNYDVSTILCSALGTILTLGLAFSTKIRCIVLMILPQLFSKRGRQALLAYAFILTMTGPAQNTLNNMGILSESLSCGQEQLKAAVRQIIDVVKKPFIAIKDAIKSIVKIVKIIVKKIKDVLITIKQIIMSILRVIRSAFQFLGKILNICNKELGTPFERCSRVFENAITDCNAKLGPLFDWVCSLTYLVKSICYLVKIFDYVCVLIDFISNSIIGTVVKKVKSFTRHVKTMFYVRIKFSHSFHFHTNASKSFGEISEGMIDEIKGRTETLTMIFGLVNIVSSLFLLMVFIKYKFFTSEQFDNRYITRDFRLIDLQRSKNERETILPLNHRERIVYIIPSSFHLVKKEKKKLMEATSVLIVASLKMAIHMMCDFSLYWILEKIKYYARFQSKIPAPNTPSVQVEGRGFFADLLRVIIRAFQPFGIELQIDTIPCLPLALPPDYDRYMQIGWILVICWFLTLLEPYGLRLRHHILCYYEPVRARYRSIWLYNQILRRRSSFLKVARRELRRNILGRKKDDRRSQITCLDYLRAKFGHMFLCKLILGESNAETCLLCAEVLNEGIIEIHRCKTPNCPGIYCEKCFKDLRNLCTVCLSPVDYGDLSDFSEEQLSEDEYDFPKIKTPMNFSGINIHISDNESRNSELKLIDESGSDYDSIHDQSETFYSYQYEKNEDVNDYRDQMQFRDLEAQYIPEFISMAEIQNQYEWTEKENDISSQLSQENYDDSNEIESDDDFYIEKNTRSSNT